MMGTRPCCSPSRGGPAAARLYHADRARRHWITKSTTHIEAMAETRPRPRRAGSKDDRITASASRKKPPIRIEADREALAAFDRRAVAAQLGVGLAAGWLASWIVGGSGLIRYVATGLIGAFVGGYLLEKLGIDLGIKNPLAARIVTATIGASLVVVLARMLA